MQTSTRVTADPDFPEELCAFIEQNVPDIDTIELLLLLADTPQLKRTIPELVAAVQPTPLAPAAARGHLTRLENAGFIKHADGRFWFEPVDARAPRIVRSLAKVFHQRPVSLVRLIYDLKDRKIRSFADAFVLK